MKWNEYRALSEKTLSTEFHCGSQVENLLHGVIGILTELEELLDWNDEVNKKEEVADVFWYLALLDRELSLNLDIIQNKNEMYQIRNETLILQTLKSSCLALDHLKKKLYYNRAIDLKNFADLINDIQLNMCTFCTLNEINVEEILNTNIEKLKARYGEKFSSEKAINRNLELERTILSQ